MNVNGNLPAFRIILRSAIGLALFAALTAGSIALTHYFTEGSIAEQKQQAEAASLYSLVPEQFRRPSLLHATVSLPEPQELNLPPDRVGWLAKTGKDVSRVVIPVTAPEGYSGDIHLLVGLSPGGKITGVRVLGHRETPGLGDRIEPSKSNWLEQFSGESLATIQENDWALKRSGGHFDAISGATITSRAVVRAIKNVLDYYRRYAPEILPGKNSTLIPANIAAYRPKMIGQTEESHP